MTPSWKDNHTLFLAIVGLLAWLIPGAGHFALGERRRAYVICVTIIAMFFVGLYIGSLGVIDPVGAKPWYAAQMMNSPAVYFLGRISMAAEYPVFGRPNEIGQIYTSIAGLLNLLCIVNAVYMAHLQVIEQEEA